MMMDVGKGVKVASDGRRSCGSPDIEGKRLPDVGQLGPHVQPLGHDAHTSQVKNAIEKGAFSASSISAGGQKYPKQRCTGVGPNPCECKKKARLKNGMMIAEQ